MKTTVINETIVYLNDVQKAYIYLRKLSNNLCKTATYLTPYLNGAIL